MWRQNLRSRLIKVHAIRTRNLQDKSKEIIQCIMPKFNVYQRIIRSILFRRPLNPKWFLGLPTGKTRAYIRNTKWKETLKKRNEEAHVTSCGFQMVQSTWDLFGWEALWSSIRSMESWMHHIWASLIFVV